MRNLDKKKFLHPKFSPHLRLEGRTEKQFYSDASRLSLLAISMYSVCKNKIKAEMIQEKARVKLCTGDRSLKVGVNAVLALFMRGHRLNWSSSEKHRI